MINPNLTDEQIRARAAELDAAHEAARLTMHDSPDDYAVYQHASDELVEFRSYWRSIGEAVDHGHPGKRTGIAISNNDGSVTA